MVKRFWYRKGSLFYSELYNMQTILESFLEWNNVTEPTYQQDSNPSGYDRFPGTVSIIHIVFTAFLYFCSIRSFNCLWEQLVHYVFFQKSDCKSKIWPLQLYRILLNLSIITNLKNSFLSKQRIYLDT